MPVLWDKKTKKIVNNESAEIIEILNADFNKLAAEGAPDLNPKETHDAQNSVNDWIYNNINNGVYRCGFAQSQSAYEAAFKVSWV